MAFTNDFPDTVKATYNYIKWLLEEVLKISCNEISVSLFLTQK